MAALNEENMPERYTDSEIHHTPSSIMNTRMIEFFYHPVLKGSREPTQEEIQQKVATYLTCHPELKPPKTENWSCFKISSGFIQTSAECYLFVSPKLLKEPEGSEDKVYYSNKEFFGYTKERHSSHRKTDEYIWET